MLAQQRTLLDWNLLVRTTFSHASALLRFSLLWGSLIRGNDSLREDVKYFMRGVCASCACRRQSVRPRWLTRSLRHNIRLCWTILRGLQFNRAAVTTFHGLLSLEPNLTATALIYYNHPAARKQSCDSIIYGSRGNMARSHRCRRDRRVRFHWTIWAHGSSISAVMLCKKRENMVCSLAPWWPPVFFQK
jgi:hypothetical protein